MEQEHPYEIRERRFRLQQRIAEMEDGAEKDALQEQIGVIQETCPHAHPEESPEKGWRCRDCDLARPPEETEQQEAADAEQPAGAAAS